MERTSENKIVLIVRKTRLDELIARFNTESQARFYVEHLGADFSDYKREHETYKAAVQAAQRLLSGVGRLQTVDREFLTNFIFGQNDTVVVLGQDGLVANCLKYLNGQSVVGVNPDPARWEGVLLPFRVPDLPKVIPDVFSRSRPICEVTMAKAELNNGQTLYGVNDLFIGPKSHTSAHYELQIDGHAETHSSSGIIVSTGLGSTGWFRSVVAGATGIAARLSGNKKQGKQQGSFEWNADYLYFSVREPWPSKTSSAETTFGKITARKPLKLISHMPENGVIFSDGIENDFLEFNSGTLALISVADKTGHLVI
jgi:NAD kinase